PAGRGRRVTSFGTSVGPFVVYARHHPWRTNEPPLPCRGHRPASRPTPTQATLPPCGVSITRLSRPGTGNHPGGRRASCVSHVLRLASHVAIRRYPEGPPSRARLSRAGTVSTRTVGDFGGPNVEASPYPSTVAVRG